MGGARFAVSIAAILVTFAACDGGAPAEPIDAGPPDAQPALTSHCRYEPLPPNAGAGGTVAEGALAAGASERLISIPVSATLGAYTARSRTIGGDGFVDARREPLAGSFASSVGVEIWPRVRAVALTTGAYSDADPAGDATVILIKADLGAAYQGLLHELEDRLGPDFAGQILFATSHSHSAFANYDGHSALQIGFGRFARTAFEAILDDMEAVAREALANRRPARIGFAYDSEFDSEDRVTRDRRGQNDDLPGGDRDDHHLYVIRVDGTDGAPIAMIPVFGMHGIVLDSRNVIASGDAPGGLERVLEDAFDDRVVVMHLQGAGGDVSPVGHESATDCTAQCADASAAGVECLCENFARVESIGWNARDEILAAWAGAAMAMQESIAIEMVTRSIARGPDWRTFAIRGGALEYAPFVDDRLPDFRIWRDPETRLELISPIDEFNASFGAALCGGTLSVPFGQMPGAGDPQLEDTPYATCNVLNPRSVDVVETAFDIEVDGSPVCDTTRTTVSAIRIGEHVMLTLPGEPTTVLALSLRRQMPLDDAHEIVVGYAQDHGGYMMTPEDWLRGGYEPTITFWGPLEGESVAERALELVELVLTDTRDDGAAGGLDRVAVPDVMDDFAPEPLPAPDAIGPAPSIPEDLVTRMRPLQPAPQPVATRRLESAFFTWIGADALHGTPVVTIERERDAMPGTFDPITRPSGRPVADGHVILTTTPEPRERIAGAPPRTHYWTAEWQVVGWADAQRGDADPLARLRDRVAAPLGVYRFHVVGPPGAGGAPLYELYSDPFEVEPATLSVTGTVSGTTVTLDLGFQAPDGYRLLDPVAGANGRFPMRGGTVRVQIDALPEITDVTVGPDGRATVTAPPTWASMTITDADANVGTFLHP